MVAALNALPWRQYAYLMRLNKPIGILLLLWPTWWALWLAADGAPRQSIFLIFTLGVVVMRSAGCIVNDICDRNFDKHVARTNQRPLAAGTVTLTEAVVLALLLGALALVLVLFCNALTIKLAFLGAFFATVYPLLKRITHLPQCGLGIAFSWGIPMAFAATHGEVTDSAWLLFTAAAIWPIIYDTMYAMTDREDDIKVGVKSTAILFGRNDILILILLTGLFIGMLAIVGFVFALSIYYFVALTLVSGLFVGQFYRIRTRDPQQCFQAFLNNNWVGLWLFVGILLGLH